MYEKRSSLQENTIERFQRLSGANKSHEYQQKKEKEPSKDSRSKLVSQHEANRYSLQMNPQPEKKAPETQLFTN